MTAARLTTVCGSCGDVLWEDEAAGHRCKPRLVAELEQRVVDLEKRQADLEKQLTGTLLALDIIRSARTGRDMITPGTTRVCEVVPLDRAVRSGQVTARAGRTTRAALGRGRSPVTSLPQRAPAGGVVA